MKREQLRQLKNFIPVIEDKEELATVFEIVIGSCTRELGSREVIASAFMDALAKYQALSETPG